MIGEVVHSVQAKMQQSVAEQEHKVAEVRDSKTGLEHKAEEAGAVAAKAAEILAGKRAVLRDVSAALLEQQSQLMSATQAQERGDAPFVVMREEKEQYEALTAQEFKAVREGTEHTKTH